MTTTQGWTSNDAVLFEELLIKANSINMAGMVQRIQTEVMSRMKRQQQGEVVA